MISVVIPLYNKAGTIARAINSVIDQKFPSVEIIVVDDGSTDTGPDIVREFRDDRVLLVRQNNAGVAAARNTGAQSAKSEWVAFLDADDWWLPDHLAGLSALVTSYPDAVLCGSAYGLVEPDGGCRHSAIPATWVRRVADMGCLVSLGKDAAMRGLPICASSVMCRRSVLLEIGGFPSGVNNGEDWLTWLSLSCQGTVAYIANVSAMYDEPSVLDDRGRLPQRPDLVGTALSVLIENNPEHAEGLKSFLALWYRMRATLYLQRNKRLWCLGELVKAVRLDRVRVRDAVSVLSLALPSIIRTRLLARKRLAQRMKERVT